MDGELSSFPVPQIIIVQYYFYLHCKDMKKINIL